MPPPNPAERPSRLPLWGQAGIVLLLFLSFASGVAIWWGQTLQAEELVTPPWLHALVVLHGSLNPFQCVLFGVLVCHHIRVGWQMRANVLSGFLMEGTFAALILTGVGLYYVGSAWREVIVWAHRLCGLALPVTLAVHWVAGLRWAARVTRSGPPASPA